MSAPSNAATAATAKGLRRRALFLGIANAFEYALQFLLPVVLVRCLDTATFGEYRLLWLVIGTVMALAPLGMPEGLYYFLPRAKGAAARLYIHQTLMWLAAAGVIAALAVSLWNPFLPAAVAPLTSHGALVPAFVFLWVCAYLLDMLPTIEERVQWQAWIAIGSALTRALLLAWGAWATGEMRVLLWLLIAHVLLKLLLLTGYIARRHGLGGPWFEKKLFADQVRHSTPLGASSSLYGLRGQADQWVAASLFSLQSFAAFSVAAVIAPLAHLFRLSVSSAFMPSMSRLQASGDVLGMMDLNRRANVLAASFICPLLAFAFAFAPEMITLVYTAFYIEAVPVMRLYIVGLMAGLVEVGSLLLLLREGGFAMRVNLGALGLSIGISLAAALEFGLAGAAAGSVAAIWFDRACTLRRIAVRTGLKFAHLQDWQGLATRIGCAAAAASFAWLLVQPIALGAGPLSRIIIGGLLMLPIYVLAHAAALPESPARAALSRLGFRT